MMVSAFENVPSRSVGNFLIGFDGLYFSVSGNYWSTYISGMGIGVKKVFVRANNAAYSTLAFLSFCQVDVVRLAIPIARF